MTSRMAPHLPTGRYGRLTVGWILLVLGFAPFAVMAFWLVRLRLGKRLRSALEALSAQHRPVRNRA